MRLVDTVGDLWRVLNNVPLPSLLRHGQNYRWFRSGIAPTQEANGGQFQASVPFGTEDKAFQDVLLAAVGGVLGDNVTGVVFHSRRKGPRVSIWTRAAEPEDKLGQRLAKVLSTEVAFRAHSDISAEKGRAYTAKVKKVFYP